MSKKSKSTAVVKVTDLKVVSNMSVDKNDLVSVAVARKERELLAEKTRLTKEIKTCQANKQTLEKKLEVAVVSAFRASVGEARIAMIENTFSGLSKKFDVKVSACISHNDKDITGSINLLEKDAPYYRNGTCIHETDIPFNTEVSNLCADSEKLVKETEALQGALIKVHEGLANLSRLERQVRAGFAEKVLSQTAEGKALLDTINSGDVLLLE